MIWALLGDAVLTLAGRGLLVTLLGWRRWGRRVDSLEPPVPLTGLASLAFGFLAGAVGLGFLVTVVGVAGLPVRPWPIVGPTLTVLALRGIAPRRGGPGARRSWPVGIAGWVALGCGVRAVVSAGRALIHSNDEYAIWAAHGHVLFLTGHLDRAVFANPAAGYQHLDYPLLLPSLLSWTASWAGIANDGAAHVQVALFAAALLVVIAAVVRRWAGTWSAVAAVLVVATTTGVLTVYGQLVMADVPAAAYAIVAALLVADWIRRDCASTPNGALAVISLFCLGALLTKNEGSLWVVAVGCGGLVAVRVGWAARGRLVLAVTAAGVAYLPWVAFVRSHGLSSDVANGSRLSPGHLSAQVGQIGTTLSGMAAHWPGLRGVALAGLLVATWLGVRAGHGRLVAQFGVTVAVCWLGLVVIYLGTPTNLEPSASRTLIFPALLIGLALPTLAGMALRSPLRSLVSSAEGPPRPTYRSPPPSWRPHRGNARNRPEGSS